MSKKNRVNVRIVHLGKKTYILGNLGSFCWVTTISNHSHNCVAIEVSEICVSCVVQEENEEDFDRIHTWVIPCDNDVFLKLSHLVIVKKFFVQVFSNAFQLPLRSNDLVQEFLVK